MINLDNLKFVDGDFLNSESISDMFYENEGSFTKKHQTITFEDGDKELTIHFEVYADGKIYEDSGDYWTPPSCEVEVTEKEVTIEEVFVDGELVQLENEVLTKLEKLIEKEL